LFMCGDANQRRRNRREITTREEKEKGKRKK
jgi:hypothetical protein